MFGWSSAPGGKGLPGKAQALCFLERMGTGHLTMCDPAWNVLDLVSPLHAISACAMQKCAVQGQWGDGLGGHQWWVMGLVWWGSGLPWAEGGAWGIWERACGSLASSSSSLKCVGEQWPHLGVIQGTHQVGLLRCKARSALAAQVVGHLWVLPTEITAIPTRWAP